MGMTQEEIRVKLGIDQTSLAQGLQSAGQNIKASLSGALSGLIGGIGIGSLIAGFRSVAAEVDSIKRMVETTGMSSGMVQDLRNIAKDAGIAGGSVEQLMNKFVSKLGAGRDPQQALNDLADLFASMTDPVEKARLAIEMFGKGGTRLIPILSQGAAGVKAMTDGFNKLSEAQIEVVDKADKRILQFGTFWKVAGANVLEFADILKETFKRGGGWKNFDQVLVEKAEAEKAARAKKQQNEALSAEAGKLQEIEDSIAETKKETDKELEKSKKEQIQLTKDQIELEGELAFKEYQRWQESKKQQGEKASSAGKSYEDAVKSQVEFTLQDLAKDDTGWGTQARKALQLREWAKWNVRHGEFGLAGDQLGQAQKIQDALKKENPFLQNPMENLLKEAVTQNDWLRAIVMEGLSIRAGY